MPRFGDRWVVDRTLFEYVNGGSCACCGFNHFLPGGTKDMILAMSDLETDAANAEVSALQASPWPPNMRDQVWGDRLKLRHLMKKEMTKYATFWKDHAVALEEWCRRQPPLALKKIFQMPRTEITERVKMEYGIHSAFAVVLCTVVEQVANFPATQLPVDGRGTEEVAFESALVFDRRGGFTLNIQQKQTLEDGTTRKVIKEDVLQIWLARMRSLGGPKLLERAKKVVHDDSSDDEAEKGGDADEGLKTNPDDDDPSAGPSFRADRRIIRLLIARYWADQMMKKFLADQEQQETAVPSNATAQEGTTTTANDTTQETF